MPLRPSTWTIGDEVEIDVAGRRVHATIRGFTSREHDTHRLERVTIELPSGDLVSRRFSDLRPWPLPRYASAATASIGSSCRIMIAAHRRRRHRLRHGRAA